jgi:hypothetical protein
MSSMRTGDADGRGSGKHFPIDALCIESSMDVHDVAELMSFGRDHSTLRTLFDRAVAELESKLKFPRVKYSILV